MLYPSEARCTKTNSRVRVHWFSARLDPLGRYVDPSVQSLKHFKAETTGSLRKLSAPTLSVPWLFDTGPQKQETGRKEALHTTASVTKLYIYNSQGKEHKGKSLFSDQLSYALISLVLYLNDL